MSTEIQKTNSKCINLNKMLINGWKTLWWLVFLLIIGNYGEVNAAKKRVCIIGTGVAGISALKQVAMHPKDLEPIVFEKKLCEGGLWIYTERTNGHDEFGMPVRNNIYKYLRVNGPKELMIFPDYPHFRGENRSYITHMDTLRYIQNYTENFNLRRHIQFNMLVQKVTAISDAPDTQWKIKTQNLKTKEYTDTICDAILVCNGHYSKYYVPKIPGLKSFPGTIIHSIFYRRPEKFRGQTVVVMGAGASGTDIGLQISWFAEKVYLSHRRKLGVEIPKNMEEVPAVVSVNGNKLTLSDRRVIVADAFILCTGYEYNFPFLGNDSGIEVVQGKYVRPLYKHLVNIKHPTMAFIGIPFPSVPFTVAYAQSQYFTSVLLGKTKLPSRQQMLEEARLPPGVPINRGHYLAEGSLDYYDELAGLSNHDLLSDTLMARIFWHWVNNKKNDLMHFKDKDVVVYEDGSIELRRQYYLVYGRDYTELSVY